MDRAGIGDRVVFLGRVSHDEVARILAAADVGLAPFAPEEHRALELGWFWSPVKIFEYLASGLAVVTADIPELRQLLGEAAVRYYPAGDVEALSRALAELASAGRSLDRVRGAARQLALSRFTWDHQAAAVAELLRALVTAAANDVATRR